MAKKKTHEVSLPHVEAKKVVAKDEAEAIEEFNKASGILRSDHPYSVVDLRKKVADREAVEVHPGGDEAEIVAPPKDGAETVASVADSVDPAGAVQSFEVGDHPG